MKDRDYSVNSCRICPSVGAVLAFKGIKGCIPLIHGSQGCATYLRRYLISHFREPIDIASSSFTEETTIFGGNEQLKKALLNVSFQYKPSLIGITTSCLVETLGEDVETIIKNIRLKEKKLPPLVHVSTPSYRMTYEEAFLEAILAVTKSIVCKKIKNQKVNIITSLVSPADIRGIKNFIKNYCDSFVFFPDFSDTLDAGHNGNYNTFIKYGTELEDISAMPNANVSIELGFPEKSLTVSKFLHKEYNVPYISLPLPCGIRLTDMFVSEMELLFGKKTPSYILEQRARLVDAYIDGHKYIYGKRVAIIGEPSLVACLASFVSEIGMVIKLIATGSAEGAFRNYLRATGVILPENCIILEDTDFEEMSSIVSSEIDMVIGNSKCYKFAKKINAPLIRCGFPIHDRFGAQRIKILLYDGTLSLLDKCINTLLSIKQEVNEIGYSYL